MANLLYLKQKLLYSCTSIGLNIVSTTVSTWLLYFWSPPPDSGRPQYLDITVVGILLTVGRFWDAIIDPLIGHWSDITHSRWGRRRPFLIFATPATVITLLLLWTPPTSSSRIINGCYFLVFTVAFYTSLTLIGIPYDSSLSEMAATPAERVSLSMWKNIFGTLGVLIGALAAAPLFERFGAVWMSLGVGVILIISVLLTLLGFKEQAPTKSHSIKLIANLGKLWKNYQFIILSLSTLMVQTAYAMLLANLPYFVTVVLGKSETNVSLFQGVVVIAMMLAAPIWNWLAKIYLHRYLSMIALIGLAITSSLLFTVGLIPEVNKTIQTLVILSILAPFLGGYLILMFALMASVVDYDELLTKQRSEALYYGAFSLSAGMGLALATLIVPRILTIYGYTATAPLGVRLVFLVAAVIVVLGAIIFQGYRLGDTIEETKLTLSLKR
ncbi:MAG: MFS transporter [Aphanothece sp. CMT-3BRIN-NPC111]|jgi:GPH family glycoside/pentoside/hexuronide:cation symporter|nr:MFS transporter [Aphanothece sp. CMT-3BRIN-NPC111]